MLYIYCIYSVFNCSFVVFDWFSLYIVWAPFVNIYSKDGFWKNLNITVFKKYFFDKIFFDVCIMKLYQVYIHPWLTLMINSQIKFETLVFRLMKGLARNYLWARVEAGKIQKASCKCDSNSVTAITQWWLELHCHLILHTIKHISWFSQLARWLQCVHVMHDTVCSNPTRANFLYWTEIP